MRFFTSNATLLMLTEIPGESEFREFMSLEKIEKLNYFLKNEFSAIYFTFTSTSTRKIGFILVFVDLTKTVATKIVSVNCYA